MLWPIRLTGWSVGAPTASSTASTQSASSAMLPSTGPALRPWPGKSSARALWPWCAAQRAKSVQPLWSCSAPWMNTMLGWAGLKGLPPV